MLSLWAALFMWIFSLFFILYYFKNRDWRLKTADSCHSCWALLIAATPQLSRRRVTASWIADSHSQPAEGICWDSGLIRSPLASRSCKDFIVISHTDYLFYVYKINFGFNLSCFIFNLCTMGTATPLGQQKQNWFFNFSFSSRFKMSVLLGEINIITFKNPPH